MASHEIGLLARFAPRCRAKARRGNQEKMTSVSVIPILIVSACGITSLAAAGRQAAPPEILQRFLARDEVRVESFRAIRHLEARNDRYKKHGWMDVTTTLDPEEGFRFEVIAEGGSGYVRDKVLRPALVREVEASKTGESARAVLSEANYEFTAVEPVDDLVRVGLVPRRRDLLLVRGAVFLTPDAGDLVRIEGELAKPPSFWTRKVHIVRRYGRIAGVRVPLAIESTAQIVIAGKSTFSMTYEYEELNGEPVTPQSVAQHARGAAPGAQQLSVDPATARAGMR
jgi:hypothetical protein